MRINRNWLCWLPIVLLAGSIVTPQAQSAPTNKWDAEIEKFEDLDRQNPPARGGVLFIGSSSIRLWNSLPDDFAGLNVINRGFGGSEIADCTFYVDRIVIPLQPRMVVLYAGDNDLANGRTPQQVFDDYKNFIDLIRQKLPGIKIAFISIKPSPARVALLTSMKQANELIRSYDAHHEGLIYIDVFSAMLDKDGHPREELFGLDRLHMNKEGYNLWKSVIALYIR